MKTPEILAPAGSPEALTAALRCGADAVYVGGKSFSARQNAENFDLPQLEEAARFCHLYGAKLYLTTNTLIREEEFPALEVFVRNAVSCGIDAFLIQDLGVLSLLREIAPNVPLHASTQMTIHTPAGVQWAKEQGLSRVVVSRELSRKEIAPLCRCGIEIEQFVHGALCMSASGQCCLSAIIGSRSANRGRCAQACRLPFSSCGNGKTCALSLKDLCLVPYVKQMAEDGVASLKIEGRRKRPEYVAAAVTALVQARSGQNPDLETLRAVFSRDGFTDGYYTGKRHHMFGTRQKGDVLRTKEVLPQLEKLYQKPTGHIPLAMHIALQTGKPVHLTAQDLDGNTVSLTGEIPQQAAHRATDVEQLKRQMEKLGGTIYFLDTLIADYDGISMLPASALNALRRKCTAEMDTLRIQKNTPQYTLQNTHFHPAEPTKKSIPQFRVLLSQREDVLPLLQQPEVEAVLLPLEQMTDSLPHAVRERVFLMMPRFFSHENKLTAQLKQAKQMGYPHIVCENLAHLHLGKQLGMTLHGGMGLNITNCRALSFLQNQGVCDTMLSPELTVTQTRSCTGLPIGLYVYGNLPVMTMRNCPIQNEIGCHRCTGQLTDRTGRHFPVRCHPDSGIVTMYNAVPTWMADKLEQLQHAAFWLLDCTLAPNPMAIFHAYQNRLSSAESMTRGLYYRGVE